MARREFQEHQNRRKQPSVEISHALYLDRNNPKNTNSLILAAANVFQTPNSSREPKNLKHTLKKVMRKKRLYSLVRT